MVEVVDQEARDKVREALHAVNNHVMVTDIKLNTIDKKIDEMKAQQKWFIGIVVMLFISTLTWSLAQQYNANEAQKKDMVNQIELLKEQERARNASRSEILNRLPPGTAESTDTSGAIAQLPDLRNDRSNDRAKD